MTHTTLSIKMLYIIKRKFFHEKKNNKSGRFYLVFDIRLGGLMRDLFSRTTEGRQWPLGQTEFIV